MTTDITYKIADILRLEKPELAERLNDQAQELIDNKCIDPIIGRLIDENDVKYLFSALELEDEDFAEFFPQIAGIKKNERRQFIETIETHFNRCKHCTLKRGYDEELDGQIKNICLQNKDALLLMLDEDADISEGEHQNIEIIEINDSKSEEDNHFSAHH